MHGHVLHDVMGWCTVGCAIQEKNAMEGHVQCIHRIGDNEASVEAEKKDIRNRARTRYNPDITRRQPIPDVASDPTTFRPARPRIRPGEENQRGRSTGEVSGRPGRDGDRQGRGQAGAQAESQAHTGGTTQSVMRWRASEARRPHHRSGISKHRLASHICLC